MMEVPFLTNPTQIKPAASRLVCEGTWKSCELKSPYNFSDTTRELWVMNNLILNFFQWNTVTSVINFLKSCVSLFLTQVTCSFPVPAAWSFHIYRCGQYFKLLIASVMKTDDEIYHWTQVKWQDYTAVVAILSHFRIMSLKLLTW